ncbi:MAG: hypothetical protein JXB17_05465 [Bacteroidales bacterium]|nr:hypothetical protein [Bacteroidales bacterium]
MKPPYKMFKQTIIFIRRFSRLSGTSYTTIIKKKIKRMKNKFYLLFLLVAFFLSCEKEDDFGTVTFYTNAQFALNCGPFDVEIYIDSSLVGILEEPFLPISETPECNVNSSKTILTINKPEGEYKFSARLTCSETLKYLSDFKVKKDSCSLVYIDLTYSE